MNDSTRSSLSDRSIGRHKTANLPTRVIEATILAILGVAILLTLVSCQRGTNALFSQDHHSPHDVWANLLYVGAALSGVVLSIVIVIAGRTGPAVCLMTITLASYGYAVDEPPTPPKQLAELIELSKLNKPPHPGAGVTDPIIELKVGGANTIGIDLWINGERLGKTPIEMPLSEILKRVPAWNDIPEDRLSETARQSKKSEAFRYLDDPRWAHFPFPSSEFLKHSFPDLSADLAEKLDAWQVEGGVYARVQLDGHDGVQDGSFGGRGGNGFYSMLLEFQFPHRALEIRRVLHQARLANYQVDATWYDSLDSFELNGLIAIQNAMETEPAMNRLFDEWAIQKYDLSSVQTSEEAMAKLLSIAEEADRLQQYHTASVAARAVELLGPRVDAESLTREATKLLQGTSNASYSRFLTNDRIHYGLFRSPASYPGISSGGYIGSSSSKSLKPSGMVIAYGVDSYLRQTDWNSLQSAQMRDTLSSVIVQRLVSTRIPDLWQLAIYLQGDTYQNYVANKARGVQRKEISPQAPDYIGVFFNLWWYLTANLDSSEGRQFRREHSGEFTNLADEISQSMISVRDIPTKLSFLFQDNHERERSLAHQYWPKFQVSYSLIPYLRLRYRFAYLAASEPLFDVSEYVRVALVETEPTWIPQALKRLEDLPVGKRMAIIDGLRAIRDLPEEERPEWANPESGLGFNFYQNLDTIRRQEFDDLVAAELFVEKYQADQSAEQQRPQQWLIEHASSRPLLIKTLADSGDLELQQLAVDVIREHPTPPYRELLLEMQNSNDSQIEQAIVEALQYWNEIKLSTGR